MNIVMKTKTTEIDMSPLVDAIVNAITNMRHFKWNKT